MTLKINDIVTIDTRPAKLIKSMSPSGLKNGQLWEVKFANLPCTVYRWIKEEV